MATKGIPLLARVSYRPIAYRSVLPISCTPNGFGPSNMATIATYKVPKVENENNVSVNSSIEVIC